MGFEKTQYTLDQVGTFLTQQDGNPASDVTLLTGGQWSQAFSFKRDGEKYVIRFGRHEQDYLKDRLASGFASAKLPIPRVLEVGPAYDGFYAISEYAAGTMIDDLSYEAMKQTIPSLFTVMDGIREADVSDSVGYGGTNVQGNGEYASWQDYLTAVNKDEPCTRTYGWKKGLASSPVGLEPFEIGFAALRELARDLPEVRSLVHDDLLNFNVLVNDHQITAVIDWANALRGDFLYELSMFTFWGPLYKPVKGIDWEAEARAHYQAIELEIPEFDRRLRACMLHKGLSSMSYYGYTGDWTYLAPVAERTVALAKEALL